MATPGATIAERITDLIGSEYATIPSLSYKDLIHAAFNEVADMMSIDELLKYSRTPGTLTQASEWLVEDRKILRVTRVDADSSGIERAASYVDWHEFQRAQDTGSIYQATAYSPVYSFDSKNAGAASLMIFPVCNNDGQVVKILYFAYAGDSGGVVDVSLKTYTTLNTECYMPSTSIHAIVLKSCINILQAYLSEQIQDEEDVELMQMIQNQIQSLEKSFLQEMQRFLKKGSDVKGE